MKVPQWFVPKRRLMKVANERIQERLQYVHIDNSVKNEDKELIGEVQESLSRFAHRNNIAVDFKKSAESDQTVMNIYKTYLTQHAINRRQQGLWYFATPEYKATTKFTAPKDNNNFLNGLKKDIMELSLNEATPETTSRFPARIRHENKYFDYTR